MKYENGQSLIELLVAIVIFVIVIGSISFLTLNSYVSLRLSEQIIGANFLAQEGLEAARSIRDNNWDGLINGSYGLTISGGVWQFQVEPDVIDDKFTRVITVEEIDSDRKKITSRINWQFVPARPQEINLVTYLTNWQKTTISYCLGTCTLCSDLTNQGLCFRQLGCSWSRVERRCFGNCASCEDFLDRASCQRQLGCRWGEPGRGPSL